MLEMALWKTMLERRMAALMYAPRGVEDGIGMLWTKDKLKLYNIYLYNPYNVCVLCDIHCNISIM